MYCTECGTRNENDAAFCVNCGKPLTEEQNAAPTGNNAYVPPVHAGAATQYRAQNNAVMPKRKGKAGMVIGTIVFVAAAIALMLFIRNMLSGETGSVRAGGGSECKVCAQIVKTQAALNEKRAENADRTLRDRELARWENQIEALSAELTGLYDHDCTASVKQVENEEFTYQLYDGVYTGDWRSVMPDGEGTYSGYYYSYGETFRISYSGEWERGAPNGEGVLAVYRGVEDGPYPHHYGECYYGTFENGAMTGYGILSVIENSGNQYVYLDGYWENGKLTGQANYMQYVDGELYDRGIAEGSNRWIVFSERATLEAAIEDAVMIGGLVLTAAVFVKVFSQHDGDAWVEQYVEERRAEIRASEEQARTNAQLWEEEKARYDQSLKEVENLLNLADDARAAGNERLAQQYEGNAGYLKGNVPGWLPY